MGLYFLFVSNLENGPSDFVKERKNERMKYYNMFYCLKHQLHRSILTLTSVVCQANLTLSGNLRYSVHYLFTYR